MPPWLRAWWKMLFKQRKYHRLQNPASEQSWIVFSLAVCWGAKVRSPHGEQVQNAIGENFGHKLDSNYWQANKVFWKTIRRLRGKQYPRPWRIESLFQRPFEPSHFHTIGHTGGTFGVGKYHHCSQSFPSCQNTEDCRLRWNPTWNAQSLEQRSS